MEPKPGQRHDRQKNHYASSKPLKRKREAEDLDALSRKVEELDAHPTDTPRTFQELPLSRPTQDGLSASHFKTLTQIQARAVPSALKGTDILGAARTGSGKTLAFLVPVLENLFRKRWTEYDGLGALILAPTRELAIQTFDVLRKAGRNHSFSAGLVIGGKNLQEERERLGRMNILVATPGRMQQHLDQAAEFDVANLQMLVLDEADRIMDMGFSDTVDAIIEHLPKERQTMLFSATQTKRVSDLARLNLTDPEFVSVLDGGDTATPSTLQQNYILTPLPDKLDTLWSFLRANVKKKVIVFLSSGKQVRFVYETFRHMQPGLTILHLHGRQKQAARLDITTKFSNSKHACLFCTDVAARGLDFPAVDWVVQVDCPEDADTYIHRVGRTARYEREGRSVLFLDPAEEEGMLGALGRKKISPERLNVRQKKMQHSIKNQLQNMCFRDPELKYLGQKAFVSYVRSIYIQKDKDTFDVTKLDLEGFAASLGLPGAPRVKFVKGEDAKKRKNMPRALARIDEGHDPDTDEDSPQQAKRELRTKYDRMFERQNQDVLAEHYIKLIEEIDGPMQNGHTEAAVEDDFLAVKRRFEAGDTALDHNGASDNGVSEPTQQSPANGSKKRTIQLGSKAGETMTVDSKRREKLLGSKKKLLKFKGHGEHLHFSSDSEDGDKAFKKDYYEDEAEFAKQGAADEQRRRFVEQEREKAKIRDEADKEVAKQKRREKREGRKERERMEMEGSEGGDEVRVELAPYHDGPGDVESSELEPEPRKQKEFEDRSSDDIEVPRKSRNRTQKFKRQEPQETPQSLEDLESMATQLLTAR